MTQCVTEAAVLQSEATEEPLSQAVVEAVADAEEVEPTELPTLYEAIDPDALDSLFDTTASEDAGSTSQVQFTYSGYSVCVDADGHVSLFER